MSFSFKSALAGGGAAVALVVAAAARTTPDHPVRPAAAQAATRSEPYSW